MWFDDWNDVARMVITALVVYIALIAILQFSGKRSISKLNIFDLVVTVALGSVLASVVLLRAVTVVEGIITFIALAFFQYLVSFLSVQFGWFKRLVRADARILLKDGQFQEDTMKEERVTRGEIEGAIRGKGHGEIENIAAVVLETDGSFSVIEGLPASQYTALKPLLKGGDNSES